MPRQSPVTPGANENKICPRNCSVGQAGLKRSLNSQVESQGAFLPLLLHSLSGANTGDAELGSGGEILT